MLGNEIITQLWMGLLHLVTVMSNTINFSVEQAAGFLSRIFRTAVPGTLYIFFSKYLILVLWGILQ